MSKRTTVVVDTFTGNRHIFTGNDAAIIDAALPLKPELSSRYKIDPEASYALVADELRREVTPDLPPPS